MTALPPSPFIVSSVLSMDVSAAAATSPPAPLGAAAVINSLIAEPEKSGESTAASARASSSPQLRAPVEPAAVEVGCGQAPEFNSDLDSIYTAEPPTLAPKEKVSGKTTNRELLASRLCRESGGAAPTAEMAQADGRKRAEVQGSAPSAEGGGRPSTNSDPVDHPTIPPTPDTADDASASPLFSSIDPEPCGVDFEAELDALEIELLLVGIPINARTFFTEAVSAIEPASCSSA